MALEHRGRTANPAGSGHIFAQHPDFDLTTALDFVTLTGLVELAGVDYVLATWIGTIVGSLSNFSINRLLLSAIERF